MAALSDLLVSYKQVEAPTYDSTPELPMDRLARLERYVYNRDSDSSEDTTEAPTATFRWHYDPETKSTVSSIAAPTGAGSQEFERAYDEVEKLDPEAKNRRTLLTQLAKAESGFVKDVQNRGGAPAYGYFQFMQGNYRGKNYNNIGTYAGTDIATFRKDAKLQIQAANKLAKQFISSFSQSELDRMHKMGWTDNAIIAGSWLGGPGGVRSYVFNNSDRDDGATSISKRMKQFNF
jgi:hypothetical protein